MKQIRKLMLLVVLLCAASLLIPASAQSFKNFAIDLRGQQLGGDGTMAKYLVVEADDTYSYSDVEPTQYNARFVFDNFNGTQHGYFNLVATIPVEAGDYRITLGTCKYGTGTGAVANADGTITFATFDQKATACYDADPATNIVSVVIAVPTEQSIVVACGQYTPYLAIEKLANDQYTINFVNTTADVIGDVPEATTVVKNESLTLPVNQSMYKEGYTLTGWTDGSNTYAPGATFTPTAHTTLTAVFTSNTVSIPTATSSVSVRWYFGESNGAPSVHFEGGAGNGYLITQAIVDGVAIDAKLDIDATSGKFLNTGRNDQWAQVNATTTFAFLSKQGAIVNLYAYSDPATSTLDNQAYTAYASNTASYAAEPIYNISTFVAKDGDYYNYLELTYTAPAPEVKLGDSNADDVADFIANNNGQPFDELIIDRPVYNDMYNTLCLPFNMGALQIAASSLNGVEIREFAGASVVGDALYISVSEPVDAIVAGRPYFIKYNAALPIEKMNFEDVVINNADLDANQVNYNGVTMIGTFGPFMMNAQTGFETDGYVFLGQNNQLYWPNTTNAIKPFRAYFKINISGGGTMPIKRGMPVKISEPNNMPTEIEGVMVEENIGRKIIENGQLIIVRNGVYYNAEGQIVK